MLEMGTSGLMSGDGKRGVASASAPALVLDSTIDSSQYSRSRHNFRFARQLHAIQQESYEAETQLRRSIKVGGSYVRPDASRFSSRRVDHNKIGPRDAAVRRAMTGNSFSTSRRSL